MKCMPLIVLVLMGLVCGVVYLVSGLLLLQLNSWEGISLGLIFFPSSEKSSCIQFHYFHWFILLNSVRRTFGVAYKNCF